MALVEFLQGATGRAVRVLAGLALMGVGAWLGGYWWILVAIGVVPLAAGLFGLCLMAPLFHQPLRHAHPG